MKLISIVILSYNRPKQIERILKKFVPLKDERVEIIIKDDVSPSFLEIENIFEKYKEELDLTLKLYRNPVNLGYDKNLYDSFSISNSKYIYLLSDDDYIEGQDFQEVLDFVELNPKPFYICSYNENSVLKRVEKKPTKQPSEPLSQLVYNSILFSGLIFDRCEVLKLELDEEFLSKCIYTQVYLSIALIQELGDYAYINSSSLKLGGDGENYFGKNESAVNADVLKDRESIISDLKYQIFLRKVIFNLSAKYSEKIYCSFKTEYEKRLIAYALRCKAIDKTSYNEFVSCLNGLDIDYNYLSGLIIKAISMLPSRICSKVYNFGIKNVKKSG